MGKRGAQAKLRDVPDAGQPGDEVLRFVQSATNDYVLRLAA